MVGTREIQGVPNGGMAHVGAERGGQRPLVRLRLSDTRGLRAARDGHESSADGGPTVNKTLGQGYNGDSIHVDMDFLLPKGRIRRSKGLYKNTTKQTVRVTVRMCCWPLTPLCCLPTSGMTSSR